MEGDTWTRDGSQQPQQGTVEREALILYWLLAGAAKGQACLMLPKRNSSWCPNLPWRAQGASCALSLRVCPAALEAGGCKVQPAQPS